MTTRTDSTDDCRIDWKLALGVVQDDRDLLREVIDAVLEEMPQLLEGLEPAVDAGDAKTVQRLAHTIKGNMRTFDAQPGLVTAETLETAARGGDLSNAPAQAAQLIAEANEFLTMLAESPYASSSESV